MNAPRVPNDGAQDFADEAVIELTERIDPPFPEDNEPIIQLTDQAAVIAAPRFGQVSTTEPLATSAGVAPTQATPAAADDDEIVSLDILDDALPLDKQDDSERPLVLEDAIRADFDSQTDDFVDSLGLEITSAAGSVPSPGPPEPAAEAPVDGGPPKALEDLGTPALTAEKLEAALERVIEKIYAEKIEGILVETIERVVSREIEQIKNVLMGEREADDDR
jgi:hypothetical protein